MKSVLNWLEFWVRYILKNPYFSWIAEEHRAINKHSLWMKVNAIYLFLPLSIIYSVISALILCSKLLACDPDRNKAPRFDRHRGENRTISSEYVPQSCLFTRSSVNSISNSIICSPQSNEKRKWWNWLLRNIFVVRTEMTRKWNCVSECGHDKTRNEFIYAQ